MAEIDLRFNFKEILEDSSKHLEKIEDLRKLLSLDEMVHGIYCLPPKPKGDDSGVEKKFVYLSVVTEEGMELIIVIRREDLYVVGAYSDTYQFLFPALPNSHHLAPPVKDGKVRSDFSLKFIPTYHELSQKGKSVIDLTCISLNSLIGAINGLCSLKKEDQKEDQKMKKKKDKKEDKIKKKKKHGHDLKEVSWAFGVIALAFAECARFRTIQVAIKGLFEPPHTPFSPTTQIMRDIRKWEKDGSFVQTNRINTEEDRTKLERIKDSICVMKYAESEGSSSKNALRR